MGKQDLVDLEKRLLIVHKQFEQMVLILIRKVLNLHSILRQLRQLQQTLLKLSCLFGILLDLLILFLIHYFVLEPPFHDPLPYLFNAFHEEALELILLAHLIDLLEA